MFRVKPTILLLTMLFSAQFAVAQSTFDGKSNNMNDFFGFDGLRVNNPSLLYTQRFLKDSTYFYQKDDIDSEFETFKKAIFEYDNQGKLLIENEFEKKENQWLESAKWLYNYDEDGYVQYAIKKQWEGSREEFENYSRTFYSRNIVGLISQEIIELYQEDAWLPDRKHEYSYTNYFEVSVELSYGWQEPEMLWQPLQRKLYEYNEYKDVISETIQVWVDSNSTWINKTYRGYEYNEERQLINLTGSTWNLNSKEWIEQTIQALSYTPLGQLENYSSFDAIDPDGDAKESVEATYDEEGNLNTTLYKEWDPASNGWNSYEKHVHFWSSYLTGNLDRTEKNIECFYTNPHYVGLPWHCDGLLKNETYTLSVYDQNGGLHHTQQFVGGNYFRIAKNLKNGLYMIVLSNGLTVHTEKVLIRN